MNIEEIVRSIGETIGATATVKSVYGEPVISGKRVVVPVASIKYSFGGGGGGGEQQSGDEPKRHGGGGGGGGRVIACPVGVVEVTEEGARFVYYRAPAAILGAVAAGFLLGLLMGRCRRNKV
ncbi:MAG TPA: spore germination protein GerW family protein [Bryobacteraceae bacterium]|nr:spore germination protein GerW family protein [Bryobacteraceae bacterium]